MVGQSSEIKWRLSFAKWSVLGVFEIWRFFFNLGRSPESAGIVSRCFAAQLRKANTPLRSGPAGRVGPSLRALLLLAAQ